MTQQEAITPKTHTITRWLDISTPVDLVEQVSIYPSRYSKEYAIIGPIDDDQQPHWIAMKIYGVVEQQEEMHYDGIVTYDISIRPYHGDEQVTCYRFTEIRSTTSAEAADQLLKEHLDRETKQLIESEVRLLISHLRSLNDAQAYTSSILTRIQQAIQS